jgi:hypothetical protein
VSIFVVVVTSGSLYISNKEAGDALPWGKKMAGTIVEGRLDKVIQRNSIVKQIHYLGTFKSLRR